jgi:DNA-binding response OmpR family regulator
MRALVIEDNPRMARAIAMGLKEHGYAADVSLTGSEGLNAALTDVYDVIVLDVMLPDRDGLDVCRAIRAKRIQAPIMFLSAISAAADKVAGLDAGADDYLAKPFEFEELVSRVRALLRRGQASESAVLRVADVELDLVKRTATRSGRLVPLTNKEFALLEYLMRKPDHVLSRTQIGEHVWDMSFDSYSNVIDVYVSALRRKLDADSDRPLIHTVIGVGYMFSADPP